MNSQTLPIFFASTMSSSTSDSLFLLRKDQQEDPANSSQAAERLVFQSESTASNSSETRHSTAQHEAEAESSENDSEEEIKLKVNQQEKEDDDDGFRTPTSLDHRIPEAKQCPAPPRKPQPSLKRKASFTSSPSRRRRSNPPLDLSREVELLLFQTQRHPLSDSHQNQKKSQHKNIVSDAM
ncbi:uncharacterized protein LOC129299276 [Prosopis cineraria]|uniref:uncharacterized protein LOC129299276 n=1 Tax=Prosopis cineraria TaxID=364024 RepID=UPI00240ECCCB|nr:uncharacterized protein LOC129299276 [Prosopis cineraria]